MFSLLRNHSRVSLTIPISDEVFVVVVVVVVAYFEQFGLPSPDVNKNKGVAERATLDNSSQQHVSSVNHKAQGFCQRCAQIV